MSMSLGSKGPQRADINMTPMIDVLLVLIIIFMVITPIAPTGFKALVPSNAIDPPAPQRVSQDIVVSVLTDHTLRLNQEPVLLADLHDRLLGLFRTQLNHVLFVRGDKGLDFQQIAEVIDIARGVGLDRIALMTQ